MKPSKTQSILRTILLNETLCTLSQFWNTGSGLVGIPDAWAEWHKMAIAHQNPSPVTVQTPRFRATVMGTQ